VVAKHPSRSDEATTVKYPLEQHSAKHPLERTQQNIYKKEAITASATDMRREARRNTIPQQI
jgi:hypothetical protein